MVSKNGPLSWSFHGSNHQLSEIPTTGQLRRACWQGDKAFVILHRARKWPSLAAMWAGEVEFRAYGHDARRVDVVVSQVVVALDVIEVDGLGDTRVLVEVQQIALQIRIIHDALDIAFEVAVIDRIEANERAEQAPVRFHDPMPEKVAASGQAGLKFVERGKKRAAGFLIGSLAVAKPAL